MTFLFSIFFPFLLCLLLIIACRKESFPFSSHVFCCQASDIYYHPRTTKYRKHSTVQHGAVNPRNKQQSKYAPIKARQRRQADGVGSRQHVVERMYIQLAVLKTNEEIKICSVYKNTAGGVMRKGFACTLLFLSLLSTSSTHAAPGLFSGTMELLAFASR